MAYEEDKPYLLFWKDNAKWTALFSPIRSITANAEGVTAKIELWKTFINSYCQFCGKVSFTCDDIVNAFTRDNRTPRCIPTIIEEMAKSGELYNINDFLQMKPITKQAWSTWAWEISKTPMLWTWGKVKNAVIPAPSNKLKYIHKKTLEDKAAEILRHASNLGSDVILLGDLVSKCQWSYNQLEDALLAIHWLVCQNKAAVDHLDFENPFKVLIKFAKVDEAQVFIAEKDICKYNLLKSIKQIEAQITNYEVKMEHARKEAKAQLEKNCKRLAMCELKKKRRYENILNQQADALNNLHSLLEILDRTEVNQEVFTTMKAANSAIKNMHKESNLNEDSVLDVMDDIRDNVEAQADIDAALSKTVYNEDNEEFEKELDILLQEKAAEDELCKFVNNLKLPDFPKADPEIERQVPERNVA